MGRCEIAIEVLRDACDILTKWGMRRSVCAAPQRKVNDRNKDKTYLLGAPIAWSIGGSLTVATSSFAGELQAVFRGCDTARFN